MVFVPSLEIVLILGLIHALFDQRLRDVLVDCLGESVRVEDQGKLLVGDWVTEGGLLSNALEKLANVLSERSGLLNRNTTESD